MFLAPADPAAADAAGVAIGSVVVSYPLADLAAVPDRRTEDPEQDISRFRAAVARVEEDLRRLQSRLGEGLPAEDRAEREGVIRQFMQPGRTMWITVIGVVVISPVIYTIQAAYLHLANKLVTGADIRFGSWFSFAAWAYFVSVFGALAGFGIGNMVQANSVMDGLGYIAPELHASAWLIGVLLAVLVGLVILGGVRRIAMVASTLVPFMAILYIAAALLVLLGFALAASPVAAEVKSGSASVAAPSGRGVVQEPL